MTKKFKKILKVILKYLLPALLGWLEGDSHAVADSLSTFIDVLLNLF